MKYVVSESQYSNLMEAQKKDFPNWRNSNKKLSKNFEFKDFKEAMKFVKKVSDIAETQNHHPDITIKYNKVGLSITDHEKGDVSEKCYKFIEAVEKIKER